MFDCTSLFGQRGLCTHSPGKMLSGRAIMTFLSQHGARRSLFALCCVNKGSCCRRRSHKESVPPVSQFQPMALSPVCYRTDPLQAAGAARLTSSLYDEQVVIGGLERDGVLDLVPPLCTIKGEKRRRATAGTDRSRRRITDKVQLTQNRDSSTESAAHLSFISSLSLDSLCEAPMWAETTFFRFMALTLWNNLWKIGRGSG